MEGKTKKTEKDGEEIVKQGILRKQGGGYKSWKDRWFTLTNSTLSYYKTVESEEPIKRVSVKEIKACRQESADARVPSRFPFYFSVETDARVYVISARNETERNEWVDAICSLLIQKKPDQKKEEDAISTKEKVEDLVPTPYVRPERPPFQGKSLEREFSIEKFIEEMKSLVRSQQNSDVVFNVQGTSFNSHKAIIACRCPVIAKMFPTSGKGPSQVTIDKISADIFSGVLDFIYTGSVSLSPSNVVDTHFAAVLFELKRLQQICEVYIRENISINNVLVMLVAANKLKEDEIERFLLGYMKDVDRYTAIIKQPEAREIAQTNKDLYVMMSQVLAQPVEEFANNLDKVEVGPLNLTEDLSSLLQTLDHADLRILTKDGEIFAHKVVIGARCRLFLEEGSLGVDSYQLESHPKYEPLKFPTLDSQVVQIMLETFYGNKINLDHLEDTYGLIELADRVQEESVVGVCNDMMRQNLTKETSLKILMVSSEYELIELKHETLRLIVREAPEILLRKDLRVVLSQWPWNLIDIIRALVKGENAEFSEEEEIDNFLESEDEGEGEDEGNAEGS